MKFTKGDVLLVMYSDATTTRPHIHTPVTITVFYNWLVSSSIGVVRFELLSSVPDIRSW